MKDFHPDYPIVLGLSGKALTGKTCTADAFAPGVRPTKAGGIIARKFLQWDHLFFSLPIKRIASTRQKIVGEGAADRIRYEIHDALLDIFGRSPLYGGPPYEVLVEMVQEIAALPMDLDGGKPRTFLQQVGTEICRGYDNDCFVGWMDRKIKELHRVFRSNLEYVVDEDDQTISVSEPHLLGVVVSDARFPNEAEMLHQHPNGVVIRFSATDRVRQERALDRDKKLMSEAQLHHDSELSVDAIPTEWVVDLDTSALTVEEQVATTQEILYHQLRGLPHAP